MIEPLAVTAMIGSSLGGLYQSYKNLEFQKSQWSEIKKREDNATQRRVADLRKAGLSPTLAAGSPAAATAVPAPQMDFKSTLTDDLVKVLSLMQMKQNIAQSVAQEKLIKAQEEKAKTSMSVDMSQAQKNIADTALKYHDYNIYKQSGIPSNASSAGKSIREIVGLVQSSPAKQARDYVADKYRKAQESVKKVIDIKPKKSPYKKTPNKVTGVQG